MSTTSRSKLLPYPENIKAADRKAIKAQLEKLLGADNRLGEIIKVYCEVPGQRPAKGGWFNDTYHGRRSRCTSCNKMIETDEVSFKGYVNNGDFHRWKNFCLHGYCFVKWTNEYVDRLIQQARRAQDFAITVEQMLVEKKIWFRTPPEGDQDVIQVGE